jgi:hypothetical protein
VGDKEVMQMALETLDNMVKVDWREWDEFASVEDFVRWAKSRASFTAEALRTALAQPEPKPVAIVRYEFGRGQVLWVTPASQVQDGTPLYTAPPQREWVELTDEDIKDIEGWVEFKEAGSIDPVPLGKLVLYISHKIREKNV